MRVFLAHLEEGVAERRAWTRGQGLVVEQAGCAACHQVVERSGRHHRGLNAAAATCPEGDPTETEGSNV